MNDFRITLVRLLRKFVILVSATVNVWRVSAAVCRRDHADADTAVCVIWWPEHSVSSSSSW